MSSALVFVTLVVVAILGAATVSAQTGAPTGPNVGIGGALDRQGRRVDHPDYHRIIALEEQQERGLQQYRTGDFAQAYELLSEPARHGLKSAQHALARMHLEGHSVEKNLLVGTALFGLAAEGGDRKIKREYNKLLLSVPQQYRSLVVEQVDYYVARYGTEVQGIACRKEKRRQSNLSVVLCSKQPDHFHDFPWTP